MDQIILDHPLIRRIIGNTGHEIETLESLMPNNNYPVSSLIDFLDKYI